MRTITEKDILLTLTLICLSIAVRYMMSIKGTKYSYHASIEIKTLLRYQIYEKLLNFGLGHNSKVSTSQITQIASEGIEQIEIYFSLYLPQLFYSLLASIILFIFLSFFSIKVLIILLICVPLSLYLLLQ
ncbi:ABC transporter transmembrane region [Brevinema andersonii]|uniref:ABC transporter transmembrane region n=1 Tax=Brevinema andersonii TaxID=34097 RepID=A0A1I1DPY8_BREAD|nr:ABC transporter transmembrane domain-containing protein [Brevinema andersonii]SFB76482.1 ABC transporter transmembrane region [Brevinema andersonii]